MSVENEPLSPAPISTQPVQQDGGNKGRFEKTWTRWFVELRTKINVINAVLVNFSGLSGNGFPSLDGERWNIREMEAGSGIDIENPDGELGNPIFSLDNPEDGQIYGRQDSSWVVVPTATDPHVAIMKRLNIGF